jgi:hypothetical protein
VQLGEFRLVFLTGRDQRTGTPSDLASTSASTPLTGRVWPDPRTTGYACAMSAPGVRAGAALVVLVMLVVLAGCGTPAAPPASPSPPRNSVSRDQTAGTADGSSQTSTTDAADEGAPPDQDGRSACPAYDSWRSRSGGAGITVTY